LHLILSDDEVLLYDWWIVAINSNQSPVDCAADKKYISNLLRSLDKCLDAVSSVDVVCACVVNSMHSALSLVHVIQFIILIFVRCNRYAVITTFKSGISVSKFINVL